MRRNASDVTIRLTQMTQVLGDVKVECYNKHKMKKKVQICFLTFINLKYNITLFICFQNN